MRSLVVLFALVAAAVAAPSVGHVVAYSSPVVVAPAVYTGASAVSHQSRVDVHHSPAVIASAPVVTEQVVAPAVVEARSVYAAPLATVYSGGSAVSHQSRVDVKSSPAVVSEHVVSPAVVGPAVVEARSLYAPSVYSPSVYSPSVYASYW